MIKILNKVLEELKKDKADLSYIRGMVETLLEMDGQQKPAPTFTYNPPIIMPGQNTPAGPNIYPNITSTAISPKIDEAAVMDAQARASLATVKALADASTETS